MPVAVISRISQAADFQDFYSGPGTGTGGATTLAGDRTRSARNAKKRAGGARTRAIRLHRNGRNAMLSWALTFLIIAIVAAVLGFGGIAGTAAGIAKILFVVFLVLFIISFVMGRRPRL
jgi:uncharacterized membrane protein YtjA (UPF0391 family)